MTVTAIYRNGVFQPEEPIELAKETRVEITLPAPQAAKPDEVLDWSWRGLGYVTYVAPNFDEPLEGFAEHVQ